MPVPFAIRPGRPGSHPADAADWARALSIVAAEYGELPQGRRTALATKVYKNIVKRRTDEMMLSGATGGAVAGNLAPAVVTPGAVTAPGRIRSRPKRKVQEDLPLSNIITPLPDAFDVMTQDGAGWECPDTDEKPEHSHWQKAGYIAAGSKMGEPAGLAMIDGKSHLVYRKGGKRTAVLPGQTMKVREAVRLSERKCRGHICPKCESKDTYVRVAHEDTSMEGVEHTCRKCKYTTEEGDKPEFKPYEYDNGEPEHDWTQRLASLLSRRGKSGVNESADEVLTPEQTALRPNMIRTARAMRDRAREAGMAFPAYVDKVLDEYRASYDTPEKLATFPDLDATADHVRAAYLIAHQNLSEACAFTPQAIATALSKAGVPLASRGERHEVSGVSVVKVGDGVGWHWSDHAGAGDRHMGQVLVAHALETLGFRTRERRPGDGTFVIMHPDHVEGPRESVTPPRLITKAARAVQRLRLST